MPEERITWITRFIRLETDPTAHEKHAQPGRNHQGDFEKQENIGNVSGLSNVTLL